MKSHYIMAASAALILSSCEPAEPQHEPMPIQPIELTKAQDEMVDNGNLFAFNLIKTVSESDELQGKDFMVSPLSISFVLGALNNGATGQTSEEILSAIGFYYQYILVSLLNLQ